MNPKITIIVPVYNVEKYLEKCINSILNQTFTDFELILVNDGSIDKSGEICDYYSRKDNRIKVIHKINEGQAIARNKALDIARGDFIGFVDSDDYIEKDMYEILYNYCIEHECDISICAWTVYYKDKVLNKSNNKIEIHNKEEAMKYMVEGELYDEALWSKLFKKELFSEIRFPKMRRYEDTAITYKIFDKCNKVCYIGESKYNYIRREGSTMDNARKYINIDEIYIYDQMYKFLEENYNSACRYALIKLLNNSMRILNSILEQDKFLDYKLEYYQVSKMMSKYYMKSMKIDYYPKTVKLLFFINKLDPIMYKYVMKIRSKIINIKML